MNRSFGVEGIFWENTAIKQLENYQRKPEGIALMVPCDISEMDAEYFGFWTKEFNIPEN